MIAARLLAALLALAWAGESGPDKGLEGKALLGPEPTHWLKVYSLSPYREFWSLDLSVKSLDGDLGKVRDAFAKSGAVMTQPFDNFPASETDKTQQLSYRLSGKAAKAVVKKLRKLGRLPEPLVRPNMEPISLEEVKEKQRRLQEERDAHRKDLAAMPSTSALLDELLDHLRIVRAVRENTETEVLINMTVRQLR